MITVQKSAILLDLCVSSLRRGHANLLCIVPIFADDHRSGSYPFGVRLFLKYLYLARASRTASAAVHTVPKSTDLTDGRWSIADADDRSTGRHGESNGRRAVSVCRDSGGAKQKGRQL